MRKFLSLILTICLVASMIVSIPISANAASKTYYGYMDDYHISSDNFGKEYLQVKFYNNNGEILIYGSDDFSINGTEYSDSKSNIGDLENNFPTGKFCKYTLSSSDSITSIIYDDTAEVYSDVTYNPSTKKFVGVDTNTASLPVYYKYNGEFVKPTLDKNHKYSIEVYDYAINITSFSALNANAVINDIKIDFNIASESDQNMNVSCDSTNQDAILVVQLHPSVRPEFLTEVRAEYDNGYNTTISKLLNNEVEYTVNLFLEDKNGAIISPVYTKTVETEYYPVSYGYIKEAYPDEDLFGERYLAVYFSDNEGHEYIKHSTENLILNGEPYDFETEIPQNVFADYILVNGEIALLNFDTTPRVYTDALYKVMDAPATTSNTPGSYFAVGTTEIPLGNTPVYYKYNDKFVEPVLDEEHKYTIEVYDYAINITSISPLNTSDDINNIEIESIINSDFSQSIDIYCSATNNESVLASEIYNSKSQLITTQKSEYNDGYTLTFSGLLGEYTAKLWLEDKSGNVTSPIYEKNFKTEHINISEGFIVGYDIYDNGFGIVFQIKINENGNMVLYDSENILINGVRCDDIDDFDSIDIPSGAYAKYAILNGKITVLNFDTESVGISDFEYHTSATELSVGLIVENSFDTEKTASVLITTFKSGKLDQVLCVPVSVKAGSSKSIYENIPNTNKADTVKIFIWDGLDNISPCNHPITANISYED